METHPIIIAGQLVDLAWTQESAKRFDYRMGEAGGEPTGRQLSNPRTVTTALFKILWALLPGPVFARYPAPEDLFVAVDSATEGEVIFAAISAIWKERHPSEEKKSTSPT